MTGLRAVPATTSTVVYWRRVSGELSGKFPINGTIEVETCENGPTDFQREREGPMSGKGCVRQSTALPVEKEKAQRANVASGNPRTPGISIENREPESGASASACSLRRTDALVT